MPMDFSLGYKLCLDALWVGAAVIVPTAQRDPADVLAAIERSGATWVYLTPTHLHALLRTPLPAGGHRLPGLRVLRSGSMPISEPLRERILRELSPNLILSYGINDIDCGVTQADAATQARFPGSVGDPRPGVELEVVDEAGRAVAPGTTGEVRIRIADMPSGYVGDPDASARAFRGGWFYPGDLAVLSPEGMLTLKGRTDDLINFQGIKVLPAEIERVLAEHPGVAEAAVFPVPSERAGEVVGAAVVMHGPEDPDSVHRWARERLAAARAPRVLMVLKALPRNEAGKVLKAELAALARKRLDERK